MAAGSPFPAPDRTTGIQKAEIVIEGADGGPLPCYFNPTEYSISKANTWKFTAVNGKTAPKAEFTAGEAREMSLTLLFDETLPAFGPQGRGVGVDQMGVHTATQKLMDMMSVPDGAEAGAPTAAPPFVTFKWGPFPGFRAACTSLSITYKLFTPSGVPIRAEVKLTLKEAEPPVKGQNPTTRANAGYGVHTVRDGDTLPSISYQAYGDATKWRVIAEANGVDNPFHLRRGASLSLPRLEL
jgi:nucleoid-associated protein YgaU